MELGLALTPILSVCRWSRNLSFTGHAQLLLTPPQPMLIIFLAVPSTGSLTMVKLCMECDNVPSKQSAGFVFDNEVVGFPFAVAVHSNDWDGVISNVMVELGTDCHPSSSSLHPETRITVPQHRVKV
ncbi:hypothetical protein PCH_Pc16g13660 [Penicillium rubens Wisconsin 54-1255]|uniref:Uncharacterized protein n=1 Tax=Penicillium rubens (strain ATCC 28089 / DSM 1075 / NRRL 1951 / Wisconsin 54-1255) TaxID=500485 RepID=B6HAQ7_PENRW|nr:hypothetical protein PCH_Pc16g13660 [Penicillium rubens Wisconsin 54-1255]